MPIRPRDDDNDGASDDEEEDRNVRSRLELVDDEDEESEDEESDEPDRTVREQDVTWQSNNHQQGGTYTFHLKLSDTNYDYEQAKEISTVLYFRKEDGIDDAPPSAAANRGERVGYLTGYLLSRPSNIFYEMANSISSELQELACMFCDPHGRANRIETGLSETGVSSGGFFHIYSIEIGKGHQGNKCDLGLRLVHETLVFLKGKWNLAVMVPCLLGVHGQEWPEENDRQNIRYAERSGPNRFTAEQEEGIKVANVKIKQHFARMGFLQAGRNSEQHHAWYMVSDAYFNVGLEDSSTAIMDRWKSKQEVQMMDIFVAPDKHVPTGVDQDLNEAVGNIADEVITIDESIQSIEDLVRRRGASIDNARALHVAAALHGDSSTAVLRALVRLGGNVNTPDENGNCPLHVACCTHQPAAIRFLLSAGADKDAQNDKGDTPLKSLQDSVRNNADFQVAMGVVSPLARDVNLVLDSTVALMPAATRSLLVDGWLSPRMRNMLHTTASMYADIIRESDDSMFKKNVPTPLAECAGVFCGMSNIEYIPPEVLQRNPRGLYESFNHGWGIVFQAITNLLERNQAPTISRISHEIEERMGSITFGFDIRKYRHFLEKGGKIDFALDAVLCVTKNVLVNGDDGWVYDEYKDEIEVHPATALDAAFDIARVKCFEIKEGGRPAMMGPYRHSYHKDDE